MCNLDLSVQEGDSDKNSWAGEIIKCRAPCWADAHLNKRAGEGEIGHDHPLSCTQAVTREQGDGKRGGTSRTETSLHPGTSSGSLRWARDGGMGGWRMPPLGWEQQKQQECCGLGSEWEAQTGVSCCQPLCISPVMSQRGGLVCLILSGGRTLMYAALNSALPCRFTWRFSMRAASLTEIKGSPQSPRYYAQTYKSGLNI